MSKRSIRYPAAGDSDESLGRVVNALMDALEHIESGADVQIIFDGAGRRRRPSSPNRSTNTTNYSSECGVVSRAFAAIARARTG